MKNLSTPPRAQFGRGEFEHHVLCHLDLVYRVARKLIGDVHEAEDLVQETFLSAHRGFAEFELRAHGAKAWLLKILHNVWVNRLRGDARVPTLTADLSLDDFAAELAHDGLPSLASGQIEWEGFDEDLKWAIEDLPPEYRSVLLLWALGDLSYKEIGEVLGCAVGTVMSRLHRARQKLSEALSEYAKDRGIVPGMGS
jgi:RNA polymerase sigma-70 factor, ECF subfamily